MLTDRERAVLGLRFADWPLRDVGDAMDLCRETVRPIESRAVETMRAAVLERASGVPSAAQEAAGCAAAETQADGSAGAVIAQVALEAHEGLIGEHPDRGRRVVVLRSEARPERGEAIGSR